MASDLKNRHFLAQTPNDKNSPPKEQKSGQKCAPCQVDLLLFSKKTFTFDVDLFPLTFHVDSPHSDFLQCQQNLILKNYDEKDKI